MVTKFSDKPNKTSFKKPAEKKGELEKTSTDKLTPESLMAKAGIWIFFIAVAIVVIAALLESDYAGLLTYGVFSGAIIFILASATYLNWIFERRRRRESKSITCFEWVGLALFIWSGVNLILDIYL